MLYEFNFENTAGRHLGSVKAENEMQAKSAFVMQYAAQHNIDPRNEEHKNAFRGLMNFDRIVCVQK